MLRDTKKGEEEEGGERHEPTCELEENAHAVVALPQGSGNKIDEPEVCVHDFPVGVGH